MKTKIIFKLLIPTIISSLFVCLFFLVTFIGMMINMHTPKGGINESMYIGINESKQWISIYGQDKNNPVLLYLHGGPGHATSRYDYVITRKWSDVYTVVTWDQRGCGKSYDESIKENITAEIMMQDGKAMTEFLLEYLKVDRITLLGHSWGSYFGANLALTYPEYYDAFIGTGQFIDLNENERRLYENALIWSENDTEGRAMVEEWFREIDEKKEKSNLRTEILDRYGYGSLKDGRDYKLHLISWLNPYYSIKEKLHSESYKENHPVSYSGFWKSKGFEMMSLCGRYDYEVPFYNINGDIDYQTNYALACEYFEQVNAPEKKMFVMANGTHGLLTSRSEEFSGYVHEIADLQKRISAKKPNY